MSPAALRSLTFPDAVPILLFFEMILYLLPNLVVIIVPIAVLIGTIFIYNKLITDHELIIMQSSGVSYWQIAKPAILISLLCTIILYFFTLYFLPLSFRNHRDIFTSLKEQSLTSLVQVGQFNTMGKYTVYARDRDHQDNFLGIIIYDSRDKDKKTFFMAEKGIIFNEEEEGHLLLLKGNRQETNLKTGKPSILYFDQYIIEASKASSPNKEQRILKTHERYVGDLLDPNKKLPTSMQLEFISAAHQRLLSPLYALAFGLLGVCAMVLGHFSRKGRSGKILTACILASFLEISALVLLNTLNYSHILVPLSYMLVLFTITTCFFLLTPWANGLVNFSWSRVHS